jgi:hypothetical protein
MIAHGLLCFSVLLAYLVIVIGVRLQLGLQIPRFAAIGALFVAIHVAAWRWVSASRREMLSDERPRFLLACFAAFWTFDELFPLVRSVFSGEGLLRVLAEAVVATLVDLAIVAIIVMSTVPWAIKLYIRRQSPDTSLERTPGG